MAVQEYTIEKYETTIAYARAPARNNGRGGSEHCSSHHTRMEQLDPQEIKVEKNGVVWEVNPRFNESVELHYCPECIDQHLRDYESQDASDRELLLDAISEEWTKRYASGGQMNNLFQVADVTDDATPMFCPYCASQLEPQGEDSELLECSVHGPIDVVVETQPRPRDEVEA